MSVVIRSSKSSNAGINLLHHNINNLTDSENKVQTSYILEATILEKRPGGDVIFTTPHGLVRSNTTIPLEAGDKATIRLTKENDGTITIHVISKSLVTKNILNKIDQFGINLLNKYILQKHNEDNLPSINIFKATVSYVTANRSTLKYSNIKPGDEITIQILAPKASATRLNVVTGEILGNSHDSIIINSSIGMLTINAKSNLDLGDKILFHIVGSIDENDQTVIRSSIQKVIQDISKNKDYLTMLLDERQKINNDNHYTRFMQLVSSHGTHNMTLARLFHNAKNIPPKDVERWIEQDIVEPFESSAKSSIFSTIANDISKITKQFIDLNIIPDYNLWRTIDIPVPYSKEYVQMRIRLTQKKVVEFSIDLNHASFGQIMIIGLLTLANEESNLPNLNIRLKYTNSFPKELQEMITTSFAAHKSLTAIEGEIVFENLDAQP